MSCDVELVELDVKWRVIVQDCQQEDDALRKFVKKKTSCVVELDIKWRVVVQDCQQQGDSICKVVLKKASCDVELDVKWRVVVQKSSRRGWLNTQSCREKDVLWRWISWTRRKVTSRRARWLTRGRLVAQICQEKDVLCRWIRHKVTNRRAKIVKKRMTQYAKLSWKRRLVTLN